MATAGSRGSIPKPPRLWRAPHPRAVASWGGRWRGRRPLGRGRGAGLGFGLGLWSARLLCPVWSHPPLCQFPTASSFPFSPFPPGLGVIACSRRRPIVSWLPAVAKKARCRPVRGS